MVYLEWTSGYLYPELNKIIILGCLHILFICINVGRYLKSSYFCYTLNIIFNVFLPTTSAWFLIYCLCHQPEYIIEYSIDKSQSIKADIFYVKYVFIYPFLTCLIPNCISSIKNYIFTFHLWIIGYQYRNSHIFDRLFLYYNITILTTYEKCVISDCKFVFIIRVLTH